MWEIETLHRTRWMLLATTTIAGSPSPAAHLRAYNRVTCDLRTKPLAASERKIFQFDSREPRTGYVYRFFRVSRGRAWVYNRRLIVFSASPRAVPPLAVSSPFPASVPPLADVVVLYPRCLLARELFVGPPSSSVGIDNSVVHCESTIRPLTTL
jgi:hypothetical protein